MTNLGSNWAFNRLWCILGYLRTMNVLLRVLKLLSLRLIYNIKIFFFVNFCKEFLIVILFLLPHFLLAFIWVNYVQAIIIFEGKWCLIIIRFWILHRIARRFRLLWRWWWRAFAFVIIFWIIWTVIIVVIIAWRIWGIFYIRLLIKILFIFTTNWMILTFY